MAITQQVTCDVCGKVKRDVNHWWMASSNSGALTIWPWGEQSIADKKHYCGAECATKALNEWMQKATQ